MTGSGRNGTDPGAARQGLIGIDVGTTRVKGLLVGLDGAQLGQAERATPWQQVDGGTQADPLALAAAAVAVAVEVAGLAARQGLRAAGIGVAGMGEAGVLVDRANRPLSPVIAWHDLRGDQARIESEVGRDAFQRGTGMHLDAQPSLSKILWLMRTRPGCASAARFHSVPEWVLLALGGDPVSELSLASRTGLLDLAARTDWAPAVELTARPLLARLVLAGEPAGRAAPEPLAGAVLTVAGHDHQAAALAAGAARDGTLLDSFGTAEALVRCIRAPIDPDTVGRLADRGVSVGWGVVPDHHTVLCGLLTGMTLERLAPLLGAHDRAGRLALGQAALGHAAPDHTAPDHTAPDRVGPPAGTVLREVDGQTCLGPLADGLSPAAVWAAAVAELSDQAARAIDLIDSEVGTHRDVVLTGGWLRNPAVLAAKQAQFGAAATSGLNEAGAVGAAYLSGVAAGLLPRPPIDGLPRWRPDPDRSPEPTPAGNGAGAPHHRPASDPAPVHRRERP